MRLTDAAFEGAVERYGNTVFRLAYSYLKNRADAEDVMQETLLKLYLERKPFRSGFASFPPPFHKWDPL